MGIVRPLVLIAAGLAWATPALAQHSEDALLGECYALRRQSRYADAFARCEEAVRVSRTGPSLAQLALTEIALARLATNDAASGRWTDAATHLAAALADRQHPWVQQNRATLDEAMAQVRPHVAELQVEANEPGSTLAIDGHVVGALPLTTPLFLAPGSAGLVVRSPAGETVQRAVTLSAGQTAHESISFVRAQAPALVATPHPAIVAPRAMPAPGSLQRVLAWTAAGGAVVGFGVALGAWRAREGVVSTYVGTCPTGAVDDVVATRCSGLHAQADSDVGGWQTITTVGLVAGGVLAATSAVLFATLPSSRAGTQSSLRCGAGPGTLGMQCALRF